MATDFVKKGTSISLTVPSSRSRAFFSRECMRVARAQRSAFQEKIGRPPRASFAELHRNYDDTAGRLGMTWIDII